MAFMRPTTTATTANSSSPLMAPAPPAPPTPPVAPTSPEPLAGPTTPGRFVRPELLRKADLRNLALLLLGFVCLFVVLPAARIYPVDDDWIYFQSVRELLNWAYKPHDWTQPIALGHLAWGALFSAVFGESFTTLTTSNLVMSALCLLVFYLLLRQVSVSPQGALLGVAVLGLNPIYVYLSYSFMTDITFLAYL